MRAAINFRDDDREPDQFASSPVNLGCVPDRLSSQKFRANSTVVGKDWAILLPAAWCHDARRFWPVRLGHFSGPGAGSGKTGSSGKQKTFRGIGSSSLNFVIRQVLPGRKSRQLRLRRSTRLPRVGWACRRTDETELSEKEPLHQLRASTMAAFHAV
jgi:hypothetical protein